jgi:hypothetical protein
VPDTGANGPHRLLAGEWNGGEARRREWRKLLFAKKLRCQKFLATNKRGAKIFHAAKVIVEKIV